MADSLRDGVEPKATHVVLPVSTVTQLYRFLQRSIMEGQEAGEILAEIQRCQVVNLENNQIEE